MQSKGCFNSTF